MAKKPKNQGPPTERLVPVQRLAQDTPPEHWFQSIVVTNHDGISKHHLSPGTPIKIEFVSEHQAFGLLNVSTPTELSYWIRDGRTPAQKLTKWSNVRRVVVLPAYDLTQIGNIFSTPLASPANGVCK